MAIQVRSEPDGGREVVHDALGRRSHRAANVSALAGEPRTGAPLPIYVLGRKDAAGVDPLAGATLVGWRYPIVGGATAGLAHLDAGPAGLAYGGLSHGSLAQRLVDAAELAEDSLAERPETFEARILSSPALHLYALWLKGPTDYFVSLLDGRPPGSNPLRLISDIRPRIAQALRAARSPSGGDRNRTTN